MKINYTSAILSIATYSTLLSKNLFAFSFPARTYSSNKISLSRHFATTMSDYNNPIASLRKEYSKKGLDETTMNNDPILVFKEWFEEAIAADVLEPNAFCLSTCVNNKPSARIVLMKAFDEKGLVWYTNYESRKSQELTENPYAAATFWWGAVERSVRIEGAVEKVSDEESEEYHAVRPRASQIGAWSSQQSKPIVDRATLEQQEAASIARFDAVEKIARPKHWGGWRIKPARVEFWKGREARLHDRISYTKTGDTWTMERLQP